MEGIYNLAEGNTDDWGVLVWGQYTRDKYIDDEGKVTTKALNEVAKDLYGMGLVDVDTFDECDKDDQELILSFLGK